MSIVNATTPQPQQQSTIQILAVPLNMFFMGICFEACTVGLFWSGNQLLTILSRSCMVSRHKTSKDRESPFLPALIVIFNLFAMASFIVNVFVWIPLTEQTCAPIDFLGLFLWHVYFVTFDVFILYKSYIVTEQNRLYGLVAAICVLYRLCWTIPDLLWTGGIWNSVSQMCEYTSNPLTGLHYTIADIACDVVATLGAVTMFFKPENKQHGIKSLWFQLLKENVFRSIAILIVSPIVMYANNSGCSSDIMALVYDLQNYVVIRMMNLEIYFKEERKHVRLGDMSTESGSSKQITKEKSSQNIVSINAYHKVANAADLH